MQWNRSWGCARIVTLRMCIP